MRTALLLQDPPQWVHDTSGRSLSLLPSLNFRFYGPHLFTDLSHLPALSPAPQANPQDPRDSTLLPLRELATSNAVLAAALIGVVVLQSGQYYSERLEERERVEEEEARLARRRRRLAAQGDKDRGKGAGSVVATGVSV